MIRSLTLKLTLAFLFVGLIGATLVGLFVNQRTQTAFDEFVADRSRATLVATLADHYERNQSWSGVTPVLQNLLYRQPSLAEHFGTIVLWDASGRIVVGGGKYRPGVAVSPHEIARGMQIKVGGEVVGWVLEEKRQRRMGPDSPEAAFLSRITRAISYSALGATGLALVLGIMLARTLTQPLRELTAATQAVAKGALGRQVAVRSRDELGALTASFNQMSADLAHASALRRQMTADIAHDLRTPLSVLLGYTEALRDGKLRGSQEIFDAMHIEAQHLQHLIDDLRTLSLADAGELPLTRQPVVAGSLLERAALMYRAQAVSRRVSLEVEVADDLPEFDVDPDRMAQVLSNLLSNALRYTQAGGRITLSADSQGDTVMLRVQDTGSGIAADDLPHVFERFYRADPSRFQQDGSTGLGLAIAKSIVEAHGGTIAVESRPGDGTTFTITLPARDPAGTADLADGLPAATVPARATKPLQRSGG